MFTRICLRQQRTLISCRRGEICFRRHESSISQDTDSYGIPHKPAWSVHQLLSSYPTTTISLPTLRRLYDLSGLICPEEGSEEHQRVTQELEEMIRLVEAVKLVNTDGVSLEDRPAREDEDRNRVGQFDTEACGEELLKYSSRTAGGYYVVDVDRKK